jgi:uncharacterized protein
MHYPPKNTIIIALCAVLLCASQGIQAVAQTKAPPKKNTPTKSKSKTTNQTKSTKAVPLPNAGAAPVSSATIKVNADTAVETTRGSLKAVENATQISMPSPGIRARSGNPNRPKQALTFREEKVMLKTTTGTLHGTLLIPDNASSTATVPVVLIVNTNTVVDRNGTSKHYRDSSNHLKYLAHELGKEGIASLRYDTRGVAESEWAFVSEVYHDFERTVSDIAGWTTQLRKDKRLGTLTLMGCSMPNDYGREASLASTVVATRVPVDGLLLVAGDSRKPLAVFRAKAAMTYTPQTARMVDSLAGLLEQGQRFTLKPQDGLVYDLLRPNVQPYLLSINKYDPKTEIAKVNVPLIVLHGTKDWSIEPQIVQELAAANPKAKFVAVKDMSYHFKKGVEDDSTLPAKRAAVPIMPEIVDIVADFVYGLKRAE